jgi:hypothetical protein
MLTNQSFKLIFSITIIVALSLGGGLYKFFQFHSTATILIESEESKTKELTSVFNQIKWTTTPKRDIWMMNQSHYGTHASNARWERLAIVVDKTKSPPTARFYQLDPGPLVWSDDLPNHRSPFRVSCFNCHSNGPRAIRPLQGSVDADLSWMECQATTTFTLQRQL